jgi:quinol monooxygenase YgiN
MAFVQIIELHTSQLDEIQALEAEYLKATEGRNTIRRTVIGRDRNDPNRYLVLAFFDSYESAMENSNLPETGDFGQKQSALLDAPMAFTDLDVVEDR